LLTELTNFTLLHPNDKIPLSLCQDWGRPFSFIPVISLNIPIIGSFVFGEFILFIDTDAAVVVVRDLSSNANCKPFLLDMIQIQAVIRVKFQIGRGSIISPEKGGQGCFYAFLNSISFKFISEAIFSPRATLGLTAELVIFNF